MPGNRGPGTRVGCLRRAERGGMGTTTKAGAGGVQVGPQVGAGAGRAAGRLVGLRFGFPRLPELVGSSCCGSDGTMI